MSVDSRSAGERSTGVLLLIKRSLIPQGRPSPFCATLTFCCITQSLHFWDVAACFKYLGFQHHREGSTKVDLTPRLAGNDRCLREGADWSRRKAVMRIAGVDVAVDGKGAGGLALRSNRAELMADIRLSERQLRAGNRKRQSLQADNRPRFQRKP